MLRRLRMPHTRAAAPELATARVQRGEPVDARRGLCSAPRPPPRTGPAWVTRWATHVLTSQTCYQPNASTPGTLLPTVTAPAGSPFELRRSPDTPGGNCG